MHFFNALRHVGGRSTAQEVRVSVVRRGCRGHKHRHLAAKTINGHRRVLRIFFVGAVGEEGGYVKVGRNVERLMITRGCLVLVVAKPNIIFQRE